MMLTPEQIFNELNRHVAVFQSAQFLCSQKVAFESWFRVELFSVLCNLGFQPNQISATYNYQTYRRRKADLLSDDGSHKNLFELKSFVAKQDANKRKTFQRQINQMINEINQGYVNQIILFATFIDYGQKAMNNWPNRLSNWLGANLNWRTLGPQRLLPQYELRVWIACSP